LTVRETVLFSARLRLDPEYVESDLQLQSFVDDIIKDAELSDLANVLVGTDEGQGLSFEEKKRLSIAVELAASPSIIFLDEVSDDSAATTPFSTQPLIKQVFFQPTSGLDARAASLVVKTLRKIADGNRTICATIHQPSSAVFSMFVSMASLAISFPLIVCCRSLSLALKIAGRAPFAQERRSGCVSRASRRKLF